MHTLTVSIVLATCNGENFLENQLNSILAQSVLPTELIISDDASTDGTLSIVDEFARIATFPIVLLRNEARMGYSLNFSNAALKACSDIIIFCDQDDVWLPNKIEETLASFRNDPDALLTIHNITVVDGHLNLKIENYFRYLRRDLRDWTFVKGCATSIRKELSNAAFPLPPRMGWTHDTRIHALAWAAKKHRKTESILIKHRIHENNASGYIPLKRGLLGKIISAFENFAFLATNPNLKFLWMSTATPSTSCMLEFLEATSKLSGRSFSPEESSRLLRSAQFFREAELKIDSNIIKVEKIKFFFHRYLLGDFTQIGGIAKLLVDIIRTMKN